MELPEECWEVVFRHLSQPSQWAAVSLTCKQFLLVSNRLWASLSVQSTPSTLPGGLPRILQRFGGLQEINLNKFQGNVGRPLSDIARSGLRLRALSMQGVGGLPGGAMAELGKSSCHHSLRSFNCSRIHVLRDNDLRAIAEGFPHLEHLDISYPGPRPSYDVSITDAGIETLALKLPNLRVINVSGNYLVSDVALSGLSRGCRGLIELLLLDCPLVTDKGLLLLASQCKDLASLAVNGARVSSQGLTTFLRLTVSSLQYLDLSQMTISDELLLNLGELRLKRLILAPCKGMTSAGILGLARSCPDLMHLSLEKAHWLTDEVMEILARSLPRLAYICLNYCSLLTDSTLFCLLKSCRDLEEVEMESTGLGWGMATAPQQRCSKLRTLKIAWNKAVGDVALRGIARLCPRLVSLDVSHCLLVTDSGLTAVSRGCPDLRKLVLKGCRQVMTLGIDGIQGNGDGNGNASAGFGNLELLQVEKSAFTDPGLKGVGRCCRFLLTLGLEGCLGITECGLQKVMEDCRHLRHVNLKDCKCVNLNALAWMVFCCPSLRQLVPPSSCVSDGQMTLLSRHGCEVFKL